MKRICSLVLLATLLVGGMVAATGADAAQANRATVTGTVVDSTGAPIVGAVFWLGGDTSRYKRVRTDADGDFVVSARVAKGSGAVAEGSWSFAASADDLGSFTARVRAGHTTDLGEITWDESAPISGSVSAETGADTYAVAYLVTKSGRTVATTPIDDESFGFGYASAGTYTVKVWGPRGWSYLGDVVHFGAAELHHLDAGESLEADIHAVAFTTKVKVHVAQVPGSKVSGPRVSGPNRYVTVRACDRQRPLDDCTAVLVRRGTTATITVPSGRYLVSAVSADGSVAYYFTGDAETPSTRIADARTVRVRDSTVTLGVFPVPKALFTSGGD
ncbi:MAG: carboxypeptidase-like regulatory domain-containing protein [Microbacteriaceae bacterium]